jgi:RHS repeat-associated protein
VHRHGAGATATMTGTYLPCYDGNGNVTELVNWASTTVVSARYEYSPFGETVLLEGEAIAGENPFRFSTKYTDGETGLVYYGYRYYAPELGRWLSRDPIGEEGGFNLLGMIGNDTINGVDLLGHKDCESHRLQMNPDPSKKLELFGVKVSGSFFVRGEKKTCCCSSSEGAKKDGLVTYSLNAGGSLKVEDFPLWKIPIPKINAGIFLTLEGQFTAGGSVTIDSCRGETTGNPIEGSGNIIVGLKLRVFQLGDAVEVSGSGDGGGGVKAAIHCDKAGCRVLVAICGKARARVVAKFWKFQYNKEFSTEGCSDPVQVASF